jgi:AcrR family transcriptional regulator
VSGDTRSALLTAAERLFADGGIDGPSLREITRAAGQRNTSALQYHFGDRDGLLRAVLEHHLRSVDTNRSALLDQLDLTGGGDERGLAAALVLPLVSKLDDDGGGPEYLQVAGEVVARPVRFAGLLPLLTTGPGMARWSKAVEPLLPEVAVGRPLHRRFAAIRFVHGELASRARERRSRSDHRLFTSHLVDLVTALLAAPVSRDTARLIRREPPAGGRTR